MAGNTDKYYNIYDVGLDKSLIRDVSNSSILPNTVNQSPSSENFYGDKFMGGLFDPLDGTYDPQSLRSGELPSLIGHGKKKFTDTTAGLLMGIDTDKIYKWIIGDATSGVDWAVTAANTLTIRGSVVIAGYKLFEAVVGPSNSDYTTISAALLAGKTRIFVRNGTYTNEPIWTISTNNVTIIGESYGGVDITFVQDNVNNRSIYITSNDVYFNNLKLTSYGASAQKLIVLTGKRLGLDNCILKSERQYVLEGSGASKQFCKIRNCYIDMNTTSAATVGGFLDIDYSVVEDCFFDMTNMSLNNVVVASGCAQTTFTNCRFYTEQQNDFIITGENTIYIGCHFYIHEAAIDGVFEACFFKHNGQTITNYLVTFNALYTRVNNCNFVCPTDKGILNLTVANISVNGCFFDGGNAIDITPAGAAKALMFSNNTWICSNNAAALDLTLNANVDYGNFIGNIIRDPSNSFTPTITDASTNSNVQYNLLIKG